VLDATGFTFLYAPAYHRGLRAAAPVRRALRVRTVMNLIGPMINPAAPPVQLLGVYDPDRVADVAHTLATLGCEDALVVHGGGLDEIALHAPTRAARLHDGRIALLTLSPEEAGLRRVPLEDLAGGDAGENAARLGELLDGGGRRAHREAVAINAGALLWIAGKARHLREGTELALDVLASGAAGGTLRRYVAATRAGADAEATHA
jgi:anthranilate phosphoribosyltransferase